MTLSLSKQKLKGATRGAKIIFIIEVIKFRNGRGMKIVFTSSSMSVKSREIGLSLFYLHLPSYEIQKDFFYNIQICYVCYALDSHTSYNCPKKVSDPSYKICSNCSENTHNFKICNANPSRFKCINCKGNHSTMSMSCPSRQGILKGKRSVENGTIASVVKSSCKNSLNVMNNDVLSKSVTITILATLKDMETPGSFSDQLNNLLEMNNMPKICLDGFIPPKIPLTDRPNQMSLESRATDTHESSTAMMSTLSEKLSNNTSKDTSNGWRDVGVYKISSTRTSCLEELLSAWRNDKVVFIKNNASIDASIVQSLLSRNDMPKVISLRKDQFTALRSSPEKYFLRK